MQIDTLEIDVGDRKIEAELFVEGQGPRPGVLLLHELFGLNSNVRADARHLAREGYAVLAPNLYTGGMRRYCMKMFFSADALMNRSSAPQVQEVHRCLDHLKARPECDGRLGMIGMCLTGGFVLQMARRDDMLAPVVFHHGFGMKDGGISSADAAGVQATILGHFAERDPMCPRSRVARLERDLGDKLQAHIYRGVGHGLRSQFRFTSQSAEAWERTLAFFSAQLG